MVGKIRSLRWATLVAVQLALLLSAAPRPLWAAPIQIAKLRDLSFGTCENTPAAVYTVTANASGLPASCNGAASAIFNVTADPNRRVLIIGPANVTVSNGTQNLTATLTRNPSAVLGCTGPTGTLTLYMGGSVTIPAGGLASVGVFTGGNQLTLIYFFGSC